MHPMHARKARLAAFLAQAGAVAPAAAPKLAITGVRAWTLQEPASHRAYALLRIETSAGISGYGETRSVGAVELDRARSALRGREATEYEALRPGLAAMPGIQAAVNMALLDIVGQSAKAPIYQLLGGPTRHKARALAPLAGDSESALMGALKRARDAGFRAFLVPAVPGASPNSGQAFVLANRQRLEAMRAETGEEVDFALDCGGALSPGRCRQPGGRPGALPSAVDR